MPLVDNVKSCLEYFKREALMSPQKEVVAFLGLKDEKPILKMVTNRSPEPDKFFKVDVLDQLMFGRENSFIAILHSHLYGDCEASEDFDKVSADNCELPFIIYSLPSDKFGIYVPKIHTVDVNILDQLKELW